jgi:hypothetical protein
VGRYVAALVEKKKYVKQRLENLKENDLGNSRITYKNSN